MMFDPTIFDNLKVVAEGAVYDLDLQGEILITNRIDQVDLATLSRYYAITFRKINQKETPVIFLLWGRPAQSKLNLIDTNRHYVITSPHPSPLSANRGFFGSRPFSKVNRILTTLGEKEIDWELPETI